MNTRTTKALYVDEGGLTLCADHVPYTLRMHTTQDGYTPRHGESIDAWTNWLTFTHEVPTPGFDFGPMKCEGISCGAILEDQNKR